MCAQGAGDPPLLCAADRGHLKLCQQLVAHGADIQKQSKEGVTALHSACGFGHLLIVKFLLAKGASKTVKDREGETPPDYARNYNQAEVLAVLEAAATPEGIEQMKLEAVPGYAEAKAAQAAMEVERARERESIRAQVCVCLARVHVHVHLCCCLARGRVRLDHASLYRFNDDCACVLCPRVPDCGREGTVGGGGERADHEAYVGLRAQYHHHDVAVSRAARGAPPVDERCRLLVCV